MTARRFAIAAFVAFGFIGWCACRAAGLADQQIEEANRAHRS